MHSRQWVIVTVVLCVVFAVLAFPVFLRAAGPFAAVAYTLIGFTVIWLAYLVRAWEFSRPGFWSGGGGGRRPQ
jgi:hypothetical protein